ncbi:MAG: hypothetical protein HWN81_17945 [Candidatus Lokiarchaeota archaeon]|nr:hypothetical protein [Candidatus Lokiarchaeota archaeon]
MYFDIKHNNFNIETQGSNESWKVSVDCIPQDMTIDSDNNIYVVGYDISWDRSLKLLKYDSSGAQLWNKHFAEFYIFSPLIKTDLNNNLYLVCSYRNETSQYRNTLVKFNSSGDLQWQQIFEVENIDYISDLAIDSEDNIYIYCDWDSNDYKNHSIFVMKFNSSGNQIRYSLLEESSNNIHAGGLKTDSEKNLIVSGESYYDNQWMYWIRRYNASGILKWATDSKFETFPLFVLDSSENVITIRETWENITYDRNLVLVKFDNSGNSIWNHIFDSKFINNFYYGGIVTPIIYQFDLTVDTSDNIYITWNIEIPNDSYKPDILMIKVNKSGNFEWYLTWGGPSDDATLKIDTDLKNNIYLCSDRYLVKNPVSNGKSFYRTNLWYFLLTLFGIFCFISLVSLYFIIKPRIRNVSNKL